jgi:Outer membrane protein beta-barrel family
MKNSLLLLLYFIGTTTVIAQIKISGAFKSKNNLPLDFAEIKITKNDSLIGNYFLENGIFETTVAAGSYKIELKQIDKILFSQTIVVQSNYSLGTIEVENSNELQEVFVEGKKKLIERKIDRLIFNVENSMASNSGGDALEVLKITPGVKIQNEQIKIIGKSSLSIMVDDKLIPMADYELANYLKSIPADGIKSIEVITTPPAKYDAAGNSGLLNIRLKKAKINTWNALVGATYIQRSKGLITPKTLFNYNKNKLTLSTLFNYIDGGKSFFEDEKNIFPIENWDYSYTQRLNYKRITSKIGLDYQLTPTSIIGTQIFYNNNIQKAPDSSQLNIANNISTQLTSNLQSIGFNRIDTQFKSLNLYNEILLDTLGKKVTINFDYFDNYSKNQRKVNGDFLQISANTTSFFTGDNLNDQNIRNFSGKLDLEIPSKIATFSLGSKITRSTTSNDISFFNSGFVPALVTNYSIQKNAFDYTEDIRALYISGSKKFNSKWETQLGLRLEATETQGFSSTLNQTTKNKYAKLFPSFYLSYVPTENSTFSASYNRRVSRPDFTLLNPNVFEANPFSRVIGNPFLQPAFVDNAELVYTYKNLENKIYYSYEDNMFGQLFIANIGSQTIDYVYENHLTTNRIGISESYIFDKFKWWTSNNALDVNYSASKSNSNLAIKDQKGISSRVSTNNDFTLNSKKTWLLNLSYWYSFPGVDGVFATKEASSMSATIQYLMLDKNLRFSLKMDDIFRTELERTSYVANGVSQKYLAYYDYQGVYFSITYKFGNKKVKIVDRELGNEDEKGRSGN